jgi:hypothetical protein
MMETPPPLTQSEIDQRVLDLYDEYCHGRIDRREFLQRAGLLTVGGVSALAMAQALLPRYALAQTISFTDQRIKARYVTYPSPSGTSGTMRGYLVQPNTPGPFSAVLVIHETRGLNPYIEDVARRAATEGFLAGIRATTTTAARSRPASIRTSYGRTWSTARASSRRTRCPPASSGSRVSAGAAARPTSWP